MLTNREVVRRINRWVKKPKVHAPVCVHNESHGRLRAEIIPAHTKKDYRFNAVVVMACSKCNYRQWLDLPLSALRKD